MIIRIHFALQQNPAKAKVTRKFLVAEAIYYNSGDMAPLPRLVSDIIPWTSSVPCSG